MFNADSIIQFNTILIFFFFFLFWDQMRVKVIQPSNLNQKTDIRQACSSPSNHRKFYPKEAV